MLEELLTILRPRSPDRRSIAGTDHAPDPVSMGLDNQAVLEWATQAIKVPVGQTG